MFDFSCHTQAVEQCVKLVTETEEVYSKARRDGFVPVTMEFWRHMSRLDWNKI